MEFMLSPDDLAFRDELRAFIAQHLPADVAARNRRGYPFLKDDCLWWTKVLATRGWSAPMWPIEYGGTGWSIVRQHLFEEECWLAGAPQLSWQGLKLAGPVIYTFGTDAQKRRFLPAIVNGEYLWAQGFSEPNAGSDLASLRTAAVRDGDDYVVSGHKIWTSEAHMSDWLFCLVRTDGTDKPQQGISMLLIRLDSPGITIRPIVSIDECHTLNEVFLDNVRVPADQRVGEEGKGWTYAKFVLGLERTNSAEVPRLKRGLSRLKGIARRVPYRDRPLIEHPAFALRIAQAEIDLLALQMTVWRTIAAEGDDGAPASPVAASILKIRGGELLQKIGELSAEALGNSAVEFYPEPPTGATAPVPGSGEDLGAGVFADLAYRRAATIYGGSNDIQRNLIARSLLGS